MSLPPLQTEFQGREISLECTHKKKFPPSQMYGLSIEDIDKMWKQGVITQTLHQSLTVWKDQCGLFLMDSKCLSCPLALLQKPRPGRPHVIETENFLEARKRFQLEDQKANWTLPETPPRPEAAAILPRPQPRILTGNPNLGLAGIKAQQTFEAESIPSPEPNLEPVLESAPEPEHTPESEPISEPLSEPEPISEPEPVQPDINDDINDDIIAALADD